MSVRLIFKRAVNLIFLIGVVPLVVLYFLLQLVFSKETAFQEFSQFLSLIPGKIGMYSRAAFYKYVCTSTAIDISIGFLTVFSHVDVEIGEQVYIGLQSNIGKCRIGKNCLIGSGVHLLSGKHQHTFENKDIPIKDQGGVYTKIEIGEDCWIGNNSIIMANLGYRCVVAAGAVVTTSVEDFSIVAGNPAKLVKKIE